MIEVADVFRRFAADYLSAHGASVLPSHRRAIENILDCRTAALGGQVWRCDACATEVFSFHSCGNRSCPKCHTAQTQEWLERRQTEMLPVPYFHITVTVPAELREVLNRGGDVCRGSWRHGLLRGEHADEDQPPLTVRTDPRLDRRHRLHGGWYERWNGTAVLYQVGLRRRLQLQNLPYPGGVPALRGM